MTIEAPGRGSPVAATSRSSIAALVAVAVLVLVLAACAAPGAAGRVSGASGSGGASGVAGTDRSASDLASAGKPLAEALTGRTFLSTSVTGHHLVTGTGISLGFQAPHSVHIRAGCNYLSGDYLLDGGRLTVDTLAMTDMGCDKALMEQDNWMTGLLQQGLTVSLEGNHLTLRSGDVRILLLDREIAEPDRPLAGTVWMLDGIIDGDAASSVPQGITATMAVSGGRIHYFDGLNPSDGAAVIHGDTVEVTEVAHGGAGCASGRTCSVDMSVLDGTFSYRIDANRLTVTGPGGNGLTFVAEATSIGSASPVSPASPAPVASPGSGPQPTTQPGTGKSLPGAHDSIPPQPSPAGGPGAVPTGASPPSSTS